MIVDLLVDTFYILCLSALRVCNGRMRSVCYTLFCRLGGLLLAIHDGLELLLASMENYRLGGSLL